MIKGREALEKEEKEDILKKPKTSRTSALETILQTYGGSSYRKVTLEQLKVGCQGVLSVRLRNDEVLNIMSNINALKTPEAIFTWITEEIFK
jgi:hypothetical protein